MCVSVPVKGRMEGAEGHRPTFRLWKGGFHDCPMKEAARGLGMIMASRAVGIVGVADGEVAKSKV